MKALYYLLPLLAIAVVSCTGGKDSSDAVSQIVEIDIQKDYPKKKLILDEIADVEYIPLETTDSVLLGKSLDRAFSGDMVVLADKDKGTVAFFNRQGKLLRSFNHKGQGDREYTDLIAMCADFAKEEIFIYDYPLRYRMLVYSFDGEFKRELKLNGLERRLENFYPYDETHLVGYDTYDKKYKDPSGDSFNRYPYFLIDKQSGLITSLPLEVNERITNKISWEYVSSPDSIFYIMYPVPVCNWMKADKGIYVSDFALDTIYHCIGDKFIPKAVRTNNPDKSRNFSALCFESNRYSFFDLKGVRIDDAKKRVVPEVSKKLVFDKQDGKVYDAFVTLKDFSERINVPIGGHAEKYKPEGYYIDFYTVDLLNFYLEKRDTLKPLPKLLDGNEIMSMLDIQPSPLLGDIVNALFEAQLNGDITSKSEAEKFVKDFYYESSFK